MVTSNLETTCPWCGYKNEMTTRVSPGFKPPEDGNISICYNCCGFSVFSDHGDQMVLRFPTTQEDFEITHSPELQRAQKTLIVQKRLAGK